MLNAKDNKKSFYNCNLGMTLPEVIIGILMLSAFTGLFVIVTEFTTRFYKNSDYNIDFIKDKHELLLAMDQYSEILSQPGVKLNDILKMTCSYPNPPNMLWGLPGVERRYVPDGYKLCIFPTSLVESNSSDLEDAIEGSNPGVYILYALPDKITIDAMPLRRIFCRPKPYC